jgi:type II restriction enzyme
MNFEKLTSTLTSSIFSWDYFSDFKKISDNTFKVKIQLNILNSLLGENNVEEKFLELVKQYPETRNVLPLLIAVRSFDKEILDRETLEIKDIKHLFTEKADFQDQDMLNFFIKSGLKEIFESKKITNLEDYIFGVETGLDSNARKNRT